MTVWFMALMEGLISASKTRSHFEIVGIENHEKRIVGELTFDEETDLYLAENIVEQEEAIYNENHSHKPISNILRVLYAKARSEFGLMTLFDPTTEKNLNNPDIEKVQANYGLISDCHNIIDYAKCILLNYYIVFGDFSQIKTCGYSKSKKIFYENYLGKQYCSDECRLRANREKESEERRQCRDKQNHWIKDVLSVIHLSHYTLGMECCEHCDEEKYKDKILSGGGYCEQLWVKNWENLNKVLNEKRVMKRLAKIL